VDETKQPLLGTDSPGRVEWSEQRAGISTPLNAQQLAAQAEQRERERQADQEAAARDLREAEAGREKKISNWEHALHVHISQMLTTFKEEHRPRDVQRRMVWDQLQQALADAQELLWPK
jgi:flagellar biosynthesis GTPase FlhF